MLEKLKIYLANYGALIIFIVILGGIGTFYLMRNQILNLKEQVAVEKNEVERIKNNYDASLDTIRVYRDKNGNMTSQISGYKLTINEMDKKYKDLFKLYIKEKNKEPIVIVEYITKVDEKITNISTIVTDTTITFADSVRYSEGSYRAITGTIPYKITYHIKKDLVNRFAFEKALYFAYILEQDYSVKDAEVIAFKDNKIIKVKDALKDKETKNLIYRIKIKESDDPINLEDISNEYKIDKNILTRKYEDDKYVYYAGNIVPSSNIEPAVDVDELNTFGNLFTQKASLSIRQSIQLSTSLSKDKKTNKILIDVRSDYPGISFDNIVGADIMENPASRKIARGFRKEFGIGVNMGYGFQLIPDVNNGYVIKRGPTVSIGLNWTPKIFQFGN